MRCLTAWTRRSWQRTEAERLAGIVVQTSAGGSEPWQPAPAELWFGPHHQDLGYSAAVDPEGDDDAVVWIADDVAWKCYGHAG